MNLIWASALLLPLSLHLQNWDGRRISPEALKGKISLVTFTYANCVKLLACSIVTINL